jgi:hypothetical protein
MKLTKEISVFIFIKNYKMLLYIEGIYKLITFHEAFSIVDLIFIELG